MFSETSFGLLGLKIGKLILLNSIMLVFAPYFCDLSKTIFNVLLIKFIKDSSISIFLFFLFSLIYSLKLSIIGIFLLISRPFSTIGYDINKFKINIFYFLFI